MVVNRQIGGLLPLVAPMKVLVLDEHQVFAMGLRACLSANPALEVVADSPEPNVDVAVVSSAIAAARAFPCPLVICGDAPLSLAPGNVVLAVLPRSTLTVERLTAGIYGAAAGLRVASDDEACRESALEGRAAAVLRLLAKGADTHEISVELGYSDRTIKTVVRELQVVLGTRNRAQTVAEGIRRGLI